MSWNKINFLEVKEFLKTQGKQTKVYIGADSERFKLNGVWFADYTLVVIVHIDGKHGCKVFGEVQRERDFDQKKNKPRMRLMNEVFKAAEVYLKLKEVIDIDQVEIHLDLNKDEKHGSSCVINEAVGYIKGMCGIEPRIKPHSFAATHCADRLKSLNVI